MRDRWGTFLLLFVAIVVMYPALNLYAWWTDRDRRGIWDCDALMEGDAYHRQWVRWIHGVFSCMLALLVWAAGVNWAGGDVRAAEVHSGFLTFLVLLFCLFTFFKKRREYETLDGLHPAAWALLALSFVVSLSWLVLMTYHR
jgi:nitrate reductase NapE component